MRLVGGEYFLETEVEVNNMLDLRSKDDSLLESFHDWCMKNDDLQNAVNEFVEKRGLFLPDNVRYISGIDFAEARIDDDPVFWIGLPPVSNYPVRETKHTYKYLRPQQQAVM